MSMPHEFVYRMPRKLYESIANFNGVVEDDFQGGKRHKKKKSNNTSRLNYQQMCDYVTKTFGLIVPCTKIVVEDTTL